MLGRKVSDAELKDRISMIGTDLESMNDKEIVVEVFPDRPDMLTAAGFAKALSSFMGIKVGLEHYTINKSDYKVKVDKKVEKVRPKMVCAVVKNVKLSELMIQYLMQVQEKLHKTFGRDRRKLSIGVYDLDSVKFPLTYTTSPRSFKFIPLEMESEMSISKILEEHPKGVDYAHLLDGFKEVPIWLDNNQKVLSIPPIINSENTKVTVNTKNLFIDVTGLDENACEQALNILVCAFAERGASVYSVNVDSKIYPNLSPKEMRLNLDYVNKVLGLSLKESAIKKLLERMGYDYSNGIVKIPCYRADILAEIDLVEDIAVAYGYENFKPELSDFGCIAEENKLEAFKNKVAEILVGFGFLETNTYNLAKKDDQTTSMKVNLKLVKIDNALNEEYNVLRSWMIPSLLDVFRNNRQHEVPQKIFETGLVFTPVEKIRLGCLITHANVTYTEARQVLDALFNALGVEGKYKTTVHDSFIPGRVARVSVKGKEVAYIGEIHPEVLNNFSLENLVVGFELDLTGLFSLI